MSQYATRQFGPMAVAFVAMKGAFAQIPASFGRLYGWLQERGHVPGGMPLAVYLSDPCTVPEAECLWELWAPIEQDAASEPANAEGLGVKRIPEMTVATTVHQGPYEEIASAYEGLIAWVAEQGLAMAGVPMEAYLNEPGEVPPSEYLTEVLLPVAPQTS